MSKTLLILALGLLAVFLGFRSLSGYETETTHLYGGDFVTLTCDADGNPVSGAGWASLSADRACATQQDDQRGHAKWWLLLGAAGVFYGYRGIRKARTGSSK
jgi:hypothetical protein